MKRNRTFSTLPWVFWMHISIRRDWFSYWWKTRGANFVELQVWIFCISIGRPWLKSVIESRIHQYGSAYSIKKTNEENLKLPMAILIN